MPLPEGWSEEPIGALVARRVHQGAPERRARYIEISGIDRLRKRVIDAPEIEPQCAPTRARQWVQTGDILVSLTRPNLNAVAPVRADLDGAVASTGFDVLRPEKVLSSWLLYRVQSPDFVKDVCQGLQGVVYPAIRPKDVRAHHMPVPPAADQARIVQTIDSYFSRLDAVEVGLERMLRNLKRYRASVLQAAVTGRLVRTEAEFARAEGCEYEPAPLLLERITAERYGSWVESQRKGKYIEAKALGRGALAALPEGWIWTSVDAVGEVLLGRQRAPQYLTGRFTRPYLRVANIKDDRIDFSGVETMDFDDVHLAKYRLQPGDILVSEGQSPELLGQSAIYRGGIEALCFQKTLHRFRPVPGGPSAEFAQIVFRSHVKNGVFAKLGSITTNIGHLTLIKFKSAPFPLPPLAEQARIVSEVERLLSVANEVDAQVQAQVARVRRLRQAILGWAFEGKLVELTDGPDSATGPEEYSR